jgi:hypothetical protein
MKILAINKIHQSKVNRAVNVLIKYNETNDLRNLSHDSDDEKLYNKYNKLCEKYFDRYLDLVTDMPKRERSNIEKTELY